MELGDRSLSTMLFQKFPIRRLWHQGEWFYSCVDCMAALAATPNARRYWSDFKRDLNRREKIEVYALGVQLIAMPDPVGKIRKTDCANTTTMLRLIESVKSPNAEPIKQWLAHVGAQVIEDGEQHQIRLQNRRRLYDFDVMLHEMVTFRGIVTAEQHEQLDDANYEGLYDMTSPAGARYAVIRYKWLGMSAHPKPRSDATTPTASNPGVGPENHMGYEELGIHVFQRSQLMARVEQRKSQGEAIYDDARDVGTEIRRTLERLGRPMPEYLPMTRPMLRITEWMSDEEIQAISDINWDELPLEGSEEGYALMIHEQGKPPQIIQVKPAEIASDDDEASES